jgi:hypothetical protein
MPTLECETDRRGGLTLVECTVHNDTTDRCRVRVENRLDGPVREPPAEALGPAWDGGAATCTLAAGERVALGYASHAPPREPPVELTHEVLERGAGTTASAPDPPTVPAPTPPDHEGTDPEVAVPAGGSLCPDGAGVALPPAVAAWLGALERRVEAVEDGRRDPSPGHATVVVDRETLAALEHRAAALEARLAAAREGHPVP